VRRIAELGVRLPPAERDGEWDFVIEIEE